MIDRKDVEHIARLARLRLTEAEKEMYLNQLNSIMEYMDKLNQLDTTETEPTLHVLPKKTCPEKMLSLNRCRMKKPWQTVLTRMMTFSSSRL